MALATGRMANIATSSGLITHVWPPAETDEGWVREAPRVDDETSHRRHAFRRVSVSDGDYNVRHNHQSIVTQRSGKLSVHAAAP